MSDKIIIGKNVETGKDAHLDVVELVEGRMLISANSRGGKSYTARKMMEECDGKIQQIVIDLEGEFSTLREKCDFLLVGKDGDIKIDIRIAELLARRVMELNVSVIIDLSELKHHERILFVKRFLDSLINLPKELWKPCLVYIDEAHQFCPEAGKSESASSVIDLMTRGGKRGYTGVLMTQRLSKLHKDTAAECNNAAMGRTFLDIDQRRSADILGISGKDDIRALRELEQGEFFLLGAAFDKGVNKVKINKVKTTHVKAGSKLIAPETPNKVKKFIEMLNDLPQEANTEINNLNQAKKEITDLRRKLTLTENSIKKPIIEKVVDHRANDAARKEGWILCENQYKLVVKDLREENSSLKKDFDSASETIRKISNLIGGERVDSVLKERVRKSIKLPEYQVPASIPIPRPNLPHITLVPKVIKEESIEEEKIGAGALKVLQAAAMFFPNSVIKFKIGAICGISHTTGSFAVYISTLKRNNLIEVTNGKVLVTQEGLEKAGDVTPVPTDSSSLIEMWVKYVGKGAGKVLKTLTDNYPNSMTKEEVGIACNISHTTGSFAVYLSTLKRNELITSNGNELKASKELFE